MIACFSSSGTALALAPAAGSFFGGARVLDVARAIFIGADKEVGNGLVPFSLHRPPRGRLVNG
ncbi:hypothetical protein [Arthrobacter psychrolactophilus]|uniref:hypothetical protein n=1 Tax=Arthrobacter psychrolactophilus TaxID=92442 RepID=UPI0011B680E6|nr:hypothetical protein [Arthrobacter psychrolactophilus]